ncbi:MAG: hypothetical protein WCA30_00115, partial [Dermatophilaceae bacterium]
MLVTTRALAPRSGAVVLSAASPREEIAAGSRGFGWAARGMAPPGYGAPDVVGRRRSPCEELGSALDCGTL